MRGTVSCSLVLVKNVIEDVLWECVRALLDPLPEDLSKEDFVRITDALGTEKEREADVQEACREIQRKTNFYSTLNDHDRFAFLLRGLSLGASCGHGPAGDEWWFTIRTSSETEKGAASLHAVLPLLLQGISRYEGEWLESMAELLAAVPEAKKEKVPSPA